MGIHQAHLGNWENTGGFITVHEESDETSIGECEIPPLETKRALI